MNLLEKTLELSRLYDIKPSRSKGQNFLIEEDYYEQAILAADIKKDDLVLEVGPGLGFLTEKLAKVAKRVVAVELDQKLADFSKVKVISQKIDNVEIVNEDILDFKVDVSLGENYKIVANLPYNITSIFLRRFLSLDKKPKIMVLMLQKEVAERIVARSPQMSLLAISVQFYAKAEIIVQVPASAFWPKPEVNSSLIKISLKNQDEIPQVDQKLFFRLVKIGYSAKRKMLKNNIGNGLHMSHQEVEKIIISSGFNSKIRAQELSLSDWLILFAKFSSFMI